MRKILKMLSISLAVVLSVSMLEMPAYGKPMQELKTESFFGDWAQDWGKQYPAAPSPVDIKLVNTQQWPSSDILSIVADYHNSAIRLLPGQTQEIVLKEYMSEDNSSYYAKTSVLDVELKITSGDRPSQSAVSFTSYMELYIPENFNGAINLHTENGVISISSVSAPMITVRSVNGQIGVFNFSGELDCKTDNGGIQLSQCAVKGNFRTENGFIDMGISEILGDITAASSNGVISASLPKTDAFTISAVTDNGSIFNRFTNDWSASDGILNGTWGINPHNRISLGSNNGTIELYHTTDGSSNGSAPNNNDLLEYQEWGVKRQDGHFYYNNIPVRIFMDLRSNHSFRYFSYNEAGTTDVKIVRDQSGAIVSIEMISKAEADMILENVPDNIGRRGIPK